MVLYLFDRDVHYLLKARLFSVPAGVSTTVTFWINFDSG